MVTFAFVLGTGRCGSTLISDVLARHPGVGFVSNVDDRIRTPIAGGRWNAAIYRRVPPWLAGRFATFFQSQADAQALPVFLHKFTGWPRAGFIDAALPEARFVHVVRDGRAVANSLVQMPWWDGFGGSSSWSWGPLPSRYEAEWAAAERSFPVLAGLEWKILIDAFESARAALPPERWHQVRYEDVLEDPRGRIEEILRFLGLPWTDDFERSFALYAFSRDRADAYRGELSSRDIRALDASLAEHLERSGYSMAQHPGEAVSA
jgi:hypothetical protein